MKRFLLLCVLGAGVILGIYACASTPPPSRPSEITVGATPDAAGLLAPDAEPPTYTESASERYAKAEAYREQGRWEEAIAIYRDVRKRFTYSRYATFSELRIADIDFARGEFAKAEEEYRTWGNDHRADPVAAHAASQRALIARCQAMKKPVCDEDTYDAGPGWPAR